ncbi:MAG: protecting protein DprA [Thermoleophilia bacterium]|nr:protecting protein DprA [Thermoleophilia bacterium]
MTDIAFIDASQPALPLTLAHAEPPFRGAWFAGDLAVLSRRPRIGIIGSRRPRADAATVARRIALEAARAGCTIVSGLAIGVDGIAHRAALDAGGTTIAVLAGGLRRVQPASNRDLARVIAGSRSTTGVEPGAHVGARGLVLSEYGPGLEDAYPYRFRERNRVIAALCDYVVVVQARHDSGSMLTADAALMLGVPIGVVPSAPDDPTYAGATRLIRDGADAVVDGTSLFRRLEVHGIMHPGFAAAAARGAIVDHDLPGGWIGGDDGQQLPLFDHPLASIVQVPRTVEEIAGLADISLRDTRRMLLELEDDGLVLHADDGTWLTADRGS